MKFSHKILVYFPHESQENAKVDHPNVHVQIQLESLIAYLQVGKEKKI